MKETKKYQGGGQVTDPQQQPVNLDPVRLDGPLRTNSDFEEFGTNTVFSDEIPLEYSPESWNIGDVDSTAYNNRLGGDDVNTQLQQIGLELARIGKVKNIDGEFVDFRDGEYENGEFDNASWYDKLMGVDTDGKLLRRTTNVTDSFYADPTKTKPGDKFDWDALAWGDVSSAEGIQRTREKDNQVLFFHGLQRYLQDGVYKQNGFYPVFDEETEEWVLQETELDEKNFYELQGALLNPYGARVSRKGGIASGIDGFSDTMSSLASSVLDFQEMTFDLYEWATTGDAQEGETDAVASDFRFAQEFNKLQKSAAANTDSMFANGEALANGIGSGLASLVQYWGLGGAIAKVAGKVGLKAAMFFGTKYSPKLASMIGHMGGGMVINSGEVYKQAKRDGIDEEEAAALALATGFVNSLIEYGVGTNALANKAMGTGGGRIISKTILDYAKKSGMRVDDVTFLDKATGPILRRVFNALEATGNTTKGIGGRFLRSTGSALEEATEEFIQGHVVYGAKQTYNMLRGEGKEYGKGKFQWEKYDMSNHLEEAALGAILGGGSRFVTNHTADRTMMQYISNGKTKDVINQINALEAQGALSKYQANKLRKRVTDLTGLWQENAVQYSYLGPKGQALAGGLLMYEQSNRDTAAKTARTRARILNNDNLTEAQKEKKLLELDMKEAYNTNNNKFINDILQSLADPEQVKEFDLENLSGTVLRGARGLLRDKSISEQHIKFLQQRQAEAGNSMTAMRDLLKALGIEETDSTKVNDEQYEKKLNEQVQKEIEKQEAKIKKINRDLKELVYDPDKRTLFEESVKEKLKSNEDKKKKNETPPSEKQTRKERVKEVVKKAKKAVTSPVQTVKDIEADAAIEAEKQAQEQANAQLIAEQEAFDQNYGQRLPSHVKSKTGKVYEVVGQSMDKGKLRYEVKSLIAGNPNIQMPESDVANKLFPDDGTRHSDNFLTTYWLQPTGLNKEQTDALKASLEKEDLPPHLQLEFIYKKRELNLKTAIKETNMDINMNGSYLQVRDTRSNEIIAYVRTPNRFYDKQGKLIEGDQMTEEFLYTNMQKSSMFTDDQFEEFKQGYLQLKSMIEALEKAYPSATSNAPVTIGPELFKFNVGAAYNNLLPGLQEYKITENNDHTYEGEYRIYDRKRGKTIIGEDIPADHTSNLPDFDGRYFALVKKGSLVKWVRILPATVAFEPVKQRLMDVNETIAKLNDPNSKEAKAYNNKDRGARANYTKQLNKKLNIFVALGNGIDFRIKVERYQGKFKLNSYVNHNTKKKALVKNIPTLTENNLDVLIKDINTQINKYGVELTQDSFREFVPEDDTATPDMFRSTVMPNNDGFYNYTLSITPNLEGLHALDAGEVEVQTEVERLKEERDKELDENFEEDYTPSIIKKAFNYFGVSSPTIKREQDRSITLIYEDGTTINVKNKKELAIILRASALENNPNEINGVLQKDLTEKFFEDYVDNKISVSFEALNREKINAEYDKLIAEAKAKQPTQQTTEVEKRMLDAELDYLEKTFGKEMAEVYFQGIESLPKKNQKELDKILSNLKSSTQQSSEVEQLKKEIEEIENMPISKIPNQAGPGERLQNDRVYEKRLKAKKRRLKELTGPFGKKESLAKSLGFTNWKHVLHSLNKQEKKEKGTQINKERFESLTDSEIRDIASKSNSAQQSSEVVTVAPVEQSVAVIDEYSNSEIAKIVRNSNNEAEDYLGRLISKTTEEVEGGRAEQEVYENGTIQKIFADDGSRIQRLIDNSGKARGIPLINLTMDAKEAGLLFDGNENFSLSEKQITEFFNSKFKPTQQVSEVDDAPIVISKADFKQAVDDAKKHKQKKDTYSPEELKKLLEDEFGEGLSALPSERLNSELHKDIVRQVVAQYQAGLGFTSNEEIMVAILKDTPYDEQELAEILDKFIAGLTLASFIPDTQEITAAEVKAIKQQARQALKAKVILLAHDSVKENIIDDALKQLRFIEEPAEDQRADEENVADEDKEMFRRFDVSFTELGGVKSLPARIKRFLSYIIMPETDFFGRTKWEGELHGKKIKTIIRKTMDGHTLSGHLMKTLSNQPTEGDMINRLEAAAQYDPVMAAVLGAINAKGNEDIKTQFLNAFNKFSVDYLRFITGPKRNFFFVNPVESSGANQIFKRWKSKTNRKVLNKELAKIAKRLGQDGFTQAGVDALVKSFGKAGWDVTPSFAAYLLGDTKLRDTFSELLPDGLDSEGYLTDLIGDQDIFDMSKGGNVRSKKVMELANIAQAFDMSTYEANYRDAKGKSHYRYVARNLYLENIVKLATNGALDTNPNNVLNNDEVLSNLTVAFAGDVSIKSFDIESKRMTKSEATNKQLSDQQRLMLMYSLFMNEDIEGYGYYIPHVIESKSALYTVRLPIKNYYDGITGITDAAIEDAYGLLLSEFKRNQDPSTQLITKKGKTQYFGILSVLNNATLADGTSVVDYLKKRKNVTAAFETKMKEEVIEPMLEKVVADLKTRTEQVGLNLKKLTPTGKDTDMSADDKIGQLAINHLINSASFTQLFHGDSSFVDDIDFNKRLAGFHAAGDIKGRMEYKYLMYPDSNVTFQGVEAASNDAQVLMTQEMFAFRELQSGNFNSATQKRAYQKLVQRLDDPSIELTPQELNSLDLNSTKTVYEDGNRYFKKSDNIITQEEAEAHPELGKIYKMLNANRIMYLIPESASKRKSDKMIEGFDTKIDEGLIHTGEMKYERNQVINRTKSKIGRETESVLAKQVHDLIGSMMTEDSSRELVDNINNANAEQKGIFLKAINSLLLPENHQAFKDMVYSMNENTRGPEVLELLQLSEDGKTYNYNLPHIRPIIQQTKISLYNKGALRSTVAGGIATLASGTHYLNPQTGKPLKIHTLKNGVIEYAEVLVSRKFFNLTKFESIEDVPEKLLTAFAARIPTQTYHSMLPIKVVGFLPDSKGDTMVTPLELPALAGSDYDLDKLFLHRYASTVVDGNQVVTPANSVKATKAYWAQQPLIKAMRRSYKDEEGNDISVEEAMERLNIGTTDNPAVLQNDMLDNMLEIFNQPEIAEMMFTPATKGVAQDVIDKYNLDFTKESIFTVVGNLDFNLANKIGETNIGIAANVNALVSMLTQMKYKLEIGFEIDGVNYNSFEPIYEDDVDLTKGLDVNEGARSKFDSISSLITLYVDNVKLGIAPKLNLDDDMTSIAGHIIGLAAGQSRAFMFVNQPILKEYTRLKSLESDLDTLSLTKKKERQGKIRETLLQKLNAFEFEAVALTTVALDKALTAEYNITELLERKELTQDEKDFLAVQKLVMQNANSILGWTGTTGLDATRLLSTTKGIKDVNALNRIRSAFAEDPNAPGADKLLKAIVANHKVYQNNSNAINYLADNLEDTFLTPAVIYDTFIKEYGESSSADLVATIQQIQTLKKDPKYNYNIALTSLLQIETNDDGKKVLVADSFTKMSNEVSAQIMGHLEDLFEDHPTLSDNLLKYLMTTSMLEFSANSFIKYMPASSFKRFSDALDLAENPTEQEATQQTSKVKVVNEVYNKIDDDAYALSLKYKGRDYDMAITRDGEIIDPSYYNPNTLKDVDVKARFFKFSSEDIKNIFLEIEQAGDIDKIIKDKLENLYPEIKLNITESPQWEKEGDNIFNQEEYRNQVQYKLKAVEALLEFIQPRDNKRTRKYGEKPGPSRLTLRLNTKDKPNIETNIRKALSGKDVSKSQIDLVFDYMKAKGIKEASVEEIITSLLADNSFVVEVNTAKTDVPRDNPYDFNLNGDSYSMSYYQGVEEDFTSYYKNGKEISYEEHQKARKEVDAIKVPTKHYSNLSAPGGAKGQNKYENDPDWEYQELAIQTPGIMNRNNDHIHDFSNSIPNMLGWIRVWYNKKTGAVEVQEVQSGLFQKGRDKSQLTKNNLQFDTSLNLKDQIKDINNKKLKLKKGNQFLQLLNKKGNWVNFFIQSIVQDSAKKGYEKVLFPTGETAAKLEGHQTLADEIIKINAELDNLNNYSIEEAYQEAMPEDIDFDDEGRPEMTPAKEGYKGWKLRYKINDTKYFGIIYKTKEEAQLQIDNKIKNLEDKKQQYKTQGLEKLKPIEAFYANRVTNILNKLYDVKQITDEYGNTWNKLYITPKVLSNILLQRNEANQIIGQANIKAGTVLIDAINQKQDTLPHEYAHHYIAWNRNTPIVQEAIKKWGSEEALVQAIGEQAVKQKGEAWNWWKMFVNWLLGDLNKLSELDKNRLTKILTDAFLTRQDLSKIQPTQQGGEVKSKKDALEKTYKAARNKAKKYQGESLPEQQVEQDETPAFSAGTYTVAQMKEQFGFQKEEMSNLMDKIKDVKVNYSPGGKTFYSRQQNKIHLGELSKTKFLEEALHAGLALLPDGEQKQLRRDVLKWYKELVKNHKGNENAKRIQKLFNTYVKLYKGKKQSNPEELAAEEIITNLIYKDNKLIKDLNELMSPNEQGILESMWSKFVRLLANIFGIDIKQGSELEQLSKLLQPVDKLIGADGFQYGTQSNSEQMFALSDGTLFDDIFLTVDANAAADLDAGDPTVYIDFSGRIIPNQDAVVNITNSSNDFGRAVITRKTPINNINDLTAKSKEKLAKEMGYNSFTDMKKQAKGKLADFIFKSTQATIVRLEPFVTNSTEQIESMNTVDPYNNMLNNVLILLETQLEQTKQNIKNTTFVKNRQARLAKQIADIKAAKDVFVSVDSFYEEVKEANDLLDLFLANDKRDLKERIEGFNKYRILLNSFTFLDELPGALIKQIEAGELKDDKDNRSKISKLNKSVALLNRLRNKLQDEYIPVLAEKLYPFVEASGSATKEYVDIQLKHINKQREKIKASSNTQKQKTKKLGVLNSRVEKLKILVGQAPQSEEAFARALRYSLQDDSYLMYLTTSPSTTSDPTLAGLINFNHQLNDQQRMRMLAVHNRLQNAYDTLIKGKNIGNNVSKIYEPIIELKNNRTTGNKDVWTLVTKYDDTAFDKAQEKAESELKASLLDLRITYLEKLDKNIDKTVLKLDTYKNLEQKESVQFVIDSLEIYLKRLETTKVNGPTEKELIRFGLRESGWFKNNTVAKTREEIQDAARKAGGDIKSWALSQMNAQAALENGFINKEEAENIIAVERATSKYKNSGKNSAMYFGYMVTRPNESYINKKWNSLYDSNDKPKNQEGEAHQTFTEIYEESLALVYKKQNVHMALPSLRKGTLDRILEKGTFSEIKESISRLFTVDQDDAIVYGIAALDKQSEQYAPVMFMDSIDANDISLDVMTSLSLFSNGALTSEKNNELLQLAYLLKDTFANRQVQDPKKLNKTALAKFGKKVSDIQEGESIMEKRLEKYIEMVLLGKTKKSEKVTIGGKEVQIDKIVDTLLSYTAVTTLGLDFLKGARNYLTAAFQQLIESGASRANPTLINASQFADGHKEMMTRIKDLYDDKYNKLGNRSFIGQMLIKFDGIQGNFEDLVGKQVSGRTAMRQFLSSDTLLINYHIGEVAAQGGAMIAHLKNKEVILDGKKYNLYNAFYVNPETGLLELAGGTEAEQAEAQKLVTKTIAEIREMNRRLNGNYRRMDKSPLSQKSGGRMVELFRKFLMPTLLNRYRTQFVNHETNQVDGGFHRWFISNMMDSWRTSTESKILDRLKDTVKRSTVTAKDKEKAFRSLYEMGTLAILMTLVGILTQMVEDDDDEIPTSAYYLLYLMTTLKGEINAFAPTPGAVSDLLRILRSPTAMTNSILRAERLIEQLFDPFAEYKKDSGVWKKGESKLKVRVLQSLGYSGGVQLDPETAWRNFTKLTK